MIPAFGTIVASQKRNPGAKILKVEDANNSSQTDLELELDDEVRDIER